jgi:Beta-ketoacyl synthase, C-terminal domain
MPHGQTGWCLSQVALHGTGTPLGDPIEVSALGQALQGRGAPQRHVVTLAAVKSCYGHTEGAAGLTGVGLLSLQFTCTTNLPAIACRAPYNVHGSTQMHCKLAEQFCLVIHDFESRV